MKLGAHDSKANPPHRHPAAADVAVDSFRLAAVGGLMDNRNHRDISNSLFHGIRTTGFRATDGAVLPARLVPVCTRPRHRELGPAGFAGREGEFDVARATPMAPLRRHLVCGGQRARESSRWRCEWQRTVVRVGRGLHQPEAGLAGLRVGPSTSVGLLPWLPETHGRRVRRRFQIPP